MVVLYTDASRMDPRTVLREHSLALRLLVIGMPLAILIGAGASALLLPGLGLAAGWLGGRLLSLADTHHYSTRVTMRLSVVSVAAIAHAGAESLGGNGFVAAFTAGLVIGSTARELLPHTTAFAEAEGQLLTLLTFLLFGAIVAAGILSDLTGGLRSMPWSVCWWCGRSRWASLCGAAD